MKLSVLHLSKKFVTKKAVDDISYDFENGIYGLLGPNGSGKSTLMRMLCGILRPSNGQVVLDGEDIYKLGSTFRDLLGYLPQDFGYYPQFTAYDFLMYFAVLKGFTKKEARQRVEEVLEMVNLTKEKKQKVKTFSGGMKQRLGIAQALLNDPKILIVDEPTAGLDPKERVKFKSILARCAQEKIVLLSTHIVSDVENLATKIIIIKNGQILCDGERAQLITGIEDKVYTFLCKEEEVDDYKKSAIITSIIPVHDRVMVRCVSDTAPTADAQLQVPNLEDLYLSMFRDEA